MANSDAKHTEICDILLIYKINIDSLQRLNYYLITLVSISTVYSITEG